MAYSGEYFWVVLCKNQRFHRKQNLYRHSIPLAETDAYAPPPQLSGDILVRCDGCGEQYNYAPKEILRAELEVPKGFVPHPLFSGI